MSPQSWLLLLPVGLRQHRYQCTDFDLALNDCKQAFGMVLRKSLSVTLIAEFYVEGMVVLGVLELVLGLELCESLSEPLIVEFYVVGIVVVGVLELVVFLIAAGRRSVALWWRFVFHRMP